MRFLADWMDAENAPDVKLSKIAQQHQDLREKIGAAVQEGDIDKVRDLLAQ
jgi:hypothetical protein